ncbi:MAG: alpha/beta hydrolase, partial [Kiritimatiellales bacterium]
MKKHILLFITLALGQTLSALPQPDQTVIYKKTDQGNLALHLFLPAGQAQQHGRPCVVFFHGGSWLGGTPEYFYAQCRALADLGIPAFAAEYRVKNKNGTTPIECVKDAKSAMRWIKLHANKLGIDPERVVAAGGSAGGQMAAATALLDDFNEESDDLSVTCQPIALVLFNPVIDTGPAGYGYDRVAAYWERFSPLNNIRRKAPPTLLMLGSRDNVIPVSSAQEYKKRMEDAGNRCDLLIYEGQQHSFFHFKEEGNPY